MKALSTTLATALILAIGVRAAAAQQPANDFPINNAYRALIIDGVAKKLSEGYVFTDRAALIQRQLQNKAVRARYDTCSTASSISNALTRDLQEWSHDRHLKVLFSVRARPIPKDGPPSAKARAEELKAAQARNFGFHQVERLQGNVGYLEIGKFDRAALAGPTAAAAMQFLANTDAIIIDVRGNGGGYADMVALVTSYFLDEQTHLSTLKRRDPNASDQIWSASFVPGPLYTSKPIYILTSTYTFSGAEGLTYNLKTFAHATVVGEKTRGGANPGGFEQIDEHFAVFVPTAQNINALTGTNWDADGITPDVAVASADAKKAAHKLALQTLVAGKAEAERMSMWKQALDEMFPANTSQVK